MAVGCGILGPLVVTIDGAEVQLGGTKEKSVFVLLALRAGEVVSSDYLIDQLWGEEPPPSAANTLQTYVSRLRKVLHASGVQVLLTRRPGYLLEMADDDIDARRFENLARAGRRSLADGDAAVASQTLLEALDLWRGRVLSDFEAEEFASAEIRRLDELRLATLEARIRADLESGRHQEVIPELEALVRRDPLREGLWASLMLALYRDGRQADALRAYQEARQILAEELGIDPGPELQQLEGMMLRQDPGLLAGPTAEVWSGNLPADITSFVGRVEELEELEELVLRSRIVTLLGPGGIGKSRLALELARRLAPEFTDGAWLVELGSATDPASIVHEIAALWHSSGDATIDELGALMHHRQALLVLDNCEQVVAGAAPVTELLLAAGPGLRIVATSREPLECRGEVLWRVGALGLDADEAEASDAVELFTARAADTTPGFRLDERSAPTVARICNRLEGIPLAIELAASRLRALTLDELEIRLDDQLRLLVTSGRTVPARQRTLQQTIEWSYELLDESERELFRRLGVFWAQFPPRAVEVVCAGETVPEAEVSSLLERLADKSLVVRVERQGRTWYRLLETIRAFAYQKIAGGHEEVHERGFLTYLAGRTDRSLKGPVDAVWSALFDGETEIARRALTVAANSFREDEGAELAGAAAALVTRTRRVAFICAMTPGDAPGPGDRLDPVAGTRALMGRFRDGFAAGAQRQDPDIQVREGWLSEALDWAEAFQNPVGAGEMAASAFADGVDVVFHAAGASGHRIFEIARRVTEDTGIHRWVIGVDFDEYRDVEEHLRPHVLASVRKQVPIDVYREIKKAVAEGRIEEAPRFGLANGGISLATSGGHLDHLLDALREVEEEIIGRAEPRA